MFSWLANAWRVPELRNRVLFTAMILAFYRLGSWIPAPGVDSPRSRLLLRPGRNRPRPAEPVLGRRALAVLALRARDHAVRHGVDHPPAPDGRDPAARRAAEGGRGGLREDHAVHALPHGRPRRGAGDGLRVPLPQPGRAARPARARWCSIIVSLTAGTMLLMWMGELITKRGIGNGISILIFASILVSRSARDRRLVERRADGEALLPAHRALHLRGRRLRPGGPAPHPDPVREAHGGAEDDGRRVDLPAAAREHGRRHPDHLRRRDPRVPADGRAVLPGDAGLRQHALPARQPGCTS